MSKLSIEPKSEKEVKESIYELLNYLSEEQLTNLNWILSQEIEKTNEELNINEINKEEIKEEIIPKKYKPWQSKLTYTPKKEFENNKNENNFSFDFDFNNEDFYQDYFDKSFSKKKKKFRFYKKKRKT